MNMREYDEKIKIKDELIAKEKAEIEKRKAKLEKLQSERKQLEDEKSKLVGQGMLNMMAEMGIVTSEKHDEMMAKFKEFMLEYATADEETAAAEPISSNENESLSDTFTDETEYLADEPTAETADDTEEVLEDFETDDTSSYSKSFYQQKRNFYGNNNS